MFDSTALQTEWLLFDSVSSNPNISQSGTPTPQFLTSNIS